MFETKVSVSEKVTARAALRRATASKHHQMHGLRPFAQIAAGTLPVDQYRQLLLALFQFHSAVAQAAHFSGLSVFSSARARLGLLRSDLSCLGNLRPLPFGNFQAGSRQAALGALYAAEGSMLGGRVIARQLHSAFGSKPDGRRFFIGSKSDGTNWSRLVEVLEAECASPHALREATSGALRTFEWFEHCVAPAAPANSALKLDLSPYPNQPSMGGDIDPTFKPHLTV